MIPRQDMYTGGREQDIIYGLFHNTEFTQSKTKHIHRNKTGKFSFPTSNRVLVQRLFAGLSPQRVRFDFSPLHVGFVAEEVALFRLYSHFFDIILLSF